MIPGLRDGESGGGFRPCFAWIALSAFPGATGTGPASLALDTVTGEVNWNQSFSGTQGEIRGNSWWPSLALTGLVLLATGALATHRRRDRR